ncbi:TetR family transcriptional regulator [Pseudomonas aeruginosa]|uniref:TetR/AcrR family transcriptional regulator n=1 Tax=Pseudomonas aeruginosa TaxID=287 RepID=UPI00066C4BA3|nr:TetR/AcrR family transcriptional regulator [Pseudomonas aeruginosa]AKQ16014.1 TetR family transcriptional regulator [Pseudomonas aeruginosa]ELC8899748.1 TetR/AcrR family transcriptional regulator [Pseudomonas aeruginosa]ELM5338228.1 TetR/AcrR family transcriptional regulator [Pseudomonas aeruginosa]
MAKRGRPCGFDREQALRRALDVFWEAGYEGATMAALKEAMGGICAPSMYAAYGSKEALFRSAVELYLSQECQLSKGAFALPTARESIAALLESAAVSYTTEGKPRGCLVDLSTTNFSPANKGVEDYLRDHRRRAARLLRERFARGVADGDVPAGADLDALTSFYSSVLQGLSIQARDGASCQQLLAIGRCAMAAWDSLLAVEAA